MTFILLKRTAAKLLWLKQEENPVEMQPDVTTYKRKPVAFSVVTTQWN